MARNTEWYYFQGKASWAKLQQPDAEFRNWNVKVHLKPESLELFKQLKETEGEVEGILNEIKRDDDGDFVTFRRPTFKRFRKGGEEEPLSPPEILDSENKPVGRHVEIGNGSDVTVKVECYKFNRPFGKGRAKAIRLVAVRIDNLVEYSQNDFTPMQKNAVAGLDGQPKQLF